MLVDKLEKLDELSRITAAEEVLRQFFTEYNTKMDWEYVCESVDNNVIELVSADEERTLC